jgi:hexosaminidase
MKTLAVLIWLSVVTVAALADDAPKLSLIPMPKNVELRGENFQLTRATRLYADESAREVAEYLAAKLRAATALPLRVERSKGMALPNRILLTTNGANINLGLEGYELAVSSTSVVLRAQTPAGLFYGVQTLLQLLPVEIFATNRVRNMSWTLPGIQIEDQPRFAWRGLMLDVSRHFFTKAEVKQLLDEMALLKLNTFHWHLVDDQGWRVEIKKYPKLTQVGAWRSGIGFGLDPKAATAYGADGRYGGFYTQSDIREVVAYAQARHITIVPEIEMPGHSVAALAAYPELCCIGEAGSTNAPAGLKAGIYCAGKEETFEFLQNVLLEIMELFPGKYLHVGGDEVPLDNWRKCERCQARIKTEGLKNVHELQSYFVRRIEKFINSKGRRLIGWSEIRTGGLAQNAAVMDWIGGATEAASEGHDVVMSPKESCYFDFYQSEDRVTEPRAIGGFLPLDQVYAFEPIPADLAPQFHQHILGTQGNVWTEYIPNFKQVEYMTFPRLSALAEVAWSPKAARNFDDFSRRLQQQNRRFDWLGVNYRREMWVKIGGWTPEILTSKGATLEWDVTNNMAGGRSQRIAFSHVEGADGVEIAWAALLEDGREISRDAHTGLASGKPRDAIYTLDVPAPKLGAHYTLRARVSGVGGMDSRGNVIWNLKSAP